MKTYDKLYYDGQWQEAKSDDYREVINSANEEVIAKVKSASKEDIDLAVQSAKEAFDSWSQLDPKDRASYLEQIAQGIEDRLDEIAETVVLELGSSRDFSQSAQAQNAVNEMRAILKDFADFSFVDQVDQGQVVKEGTGVVACITPWNFPLNQIQRKMTPALLAGNTVVVKPASETPLTAYILADIIHQVGLPKGVFNMVFGSGSSVGDYLADHPDIALISFTGSTEVGRLMYQKAGKGIKRLVLELGGKSAMVFLEGGDLEAAVKQAADTVLDNQGQTCSALSRLIVPGDRLEDTKAILKDYYQDIQVGDPSQDGVKVGPMVSKDQYQRVLDYIAKGKEEGAQVLLGGQAVEGPGYFIQPTVFTEATNDMTIAREEIFGPVLTVLTYDSVEEAIAIANDSPYGLSGAVTGPKDEAFEVAKRLRTGNVNVNQASRNPRLPFGGYKESGFGRENGIYALDDYLELKAIFE